MSVLLDDYGAMLEITEEVVKAAAGNVQSGESLIDPTLVPFRRLAYVPFMVTLSHPPIRVICTLQRPAGFSYIIWMTSELLGPEEA
ncbi:uncharacterized protein Aud_002309 [Aspergillus udagawae]|uniref:Uncharacterized protein n=1 Tax=Aspergillus udagawae TaxID=91492 RepID=A0A8E0V2T4_9EURO|nr:uncharacterized protein Aud_002309 [Aspergillus udagawae]GIC94977.1 hypothetical protein Aud_002309 [Aspergillus udagawae]